MATGGDDRYALALEEARRSLDQQKDDLKAVRDRTAATVGLGGLAATFLGGLALRDEAPLSGWTILGAGAFVALVILMVLTHRTYTFVFSQDAAEIILWAEHYKAGLAEMQRDLALWLFSQFLKNRRTLSCLWRAYQAAIVTLLVQLLALSLDLRGR